MLAVVKSRLISREVCSHAARKLLSFPSISKNIKFKTYPTIILLVRRRQLVCQFKGRAYAESVGEIENGQNIRPLKMDQIAY